MKTDSTLIAAQAKNCECRIGNFPIRHSHHRSKILRLKNPDKKAKIFKPSLRSVNGRQRNVGSESELIRAQAVVRTA